MNKIILIKYGELTTKKGNRKFFISTLYNNIKRKLEGLELRILTQFHYNATGNQILRTSSKY